MAPKGRKPLLLTDRLVEVTYICERCGTETKRSIRDSIREK
jgi:thymidine kinase